MADLILTSLMITGFVAAMMLLIEYVHVLTGGRLETALKRGRPLGYLLAAGLAGVAGAAMRTSGRGSIPGGSRIYFADDAFRFR